MNIWLNGLFQMTDSYELILEISCKHYYFISVYKNIILRSLFRTKMFQSYLANFSISRLNFILRHTVPDVFLFNIQTSNNFLESTLFSLFYF